MTFSRLKGWCAFGKMYTGSAWLSSARAVKCLVKSFNERNSCYMLVQLLFKYKGCHSYNTASDKLEEGKNDVKPLWPLWTGLHTCYNDIYKESYYREILSKSSKFIVFGLRAEIRPHEGGITSNRRSACYGELLLRPCTHRPSHAGSEFGLKL